MNKENPFVGQKLFSLNIGDNARNRPQVLTPVVVTKVGSKYFTVKHEPADYWETVYHLEDWSEKTDYSQLSKLYAKEQDWLDDKEAAALRTRLREAFVGYGRLPLSLNQLRRIVAIMEENL